MAENKPRKYDLYDRCAGSILGVAFGDALGAGVEGWAAADIASEYGEIHDFIDSRLGAGCYTDDTQMTLATARSIVRTGKIDGADCANACADAFDPERGYGRSATQILTALAKGADYTETSINLFPEGSYGNGAAMRIAPVGLLCGHVDPLILRAWVFEAVRATHTHDEAIDGALILAAAVGKLARMENSSELNAEVLLQELAPFCRTMEMRSRIMLASQMLSDESTEVVNRLGNGVRTLESVPTALYTAMKYAARPEQALVAAVSYGGDTDTIAAMTGALVGALNGAGSFPQRWHDGLERGKDGYGALLDVSCKLSEMIK